MTPNSPDLVDAIAQFVSAFCKEARIGPDNDVSAVKRDLWTQIAKRWPEARFTEINRAFSIGYEILIADPAGKRGLALIEVFRGSHP
jgi:hypothetical protein